MQGTTKARFAPRHLGKRWSLGASALAAAGWLVCFGLGAAVDLALPDVARGQSGTALDAEVERLRSSVAAERAAAAETLGRSGHALRDEITPVLRELLRNDTEWEVRASAGRALGRLGTRDAVPDLVRALRDPVLDVRVVAAAAIWRLPDPAAVPALIELLSDADANARQWAALALGVIRDVRGVNPLLGLMDDPEPAVRLDVIRSLGRIRAPHALGPLEARAASSTAPTDERIEAINALAALDVPQRIDALVRLLAVRDRHVREASIAAIGQVGDALALPALRHQRAEERVPLLRTAIDRAIVAIEGRIAAGD